ncbi:MAG TPA: hypothetical protein DHV28_00565 [Ignavibacteriales bacterium]|nr:hypothetical protein [Ignavibacteriales bacterium]
MEDKPIISRYAIDEIKGLFIPVEIPKDSELELVIGISSEELTFRELSNYFAIIDKFYGRLYSDGIYSYAHRKWEQIKIYEIRQGSIEAVIREALENSQNFVILYILLKHLPNFIKSSAEGIKNLAESYKFYQEASVIKESRRNKKAFKESLKEDQELKKLNPNHLTQLAKLLEYIYSKEYKRIPKASETSRNKIKRIHLRIRKKDN